VSTASVPARARTILFCREVPWHTELPVSTRKLAQCFAEAGWRVAWLQPPIPPWRLGSSGARKVIEQAELGRVSPMHPNVAELSPRTWAPFSLRIPGLWRPLARRNWSACVPALRRSLERAGVGQPDVLWLSHVSALGLPRLFPGVPVIWQVTDDYPLLSRTERRCRELLRWNLAQADAVLFSSPLLLDRYAAYCKRARLQPSVLPHGVDAWRLRHEPSAADPLPGVGRPRAVYVGNTQRADVTLLCALSRDVDVVVIGDPRPFEGRAPKESRLHLLGPRPPEEVARLLPACDFGIVSYSPQQMRAAAEGGNPMKAYEYAAAGLPILAPRLPVFTRLGVPVRYYDDLDSLCALVLTALSHRDDARAELRAWAARHTWEQRFAEVESILNGLLPAEAA
jgi:glycosyltransferase involved in cell wall biosynthesis